MKNKRAQISIQYIISFVLLIILIVLSFLFVTNSFQKIYSLIDEKITVSNFFYIKNLVFAFSGDPPYWNSSLIQNNRVNLLGYSIKPFVLDYEKIFENQKITENSTLYFRFIEQFSYDLGEYANNLIEKQRKWVAYYKIKNLDPLLFSKPYGYLQIKRNATNLVIFYNFSNVSNLNPNYGYDPHYFKPYFLLEIISDKKLTVHDRKEGINYTEEISNFYKIKVYSSKNKEWGYIVLNYSCVRKSAFLECDYPNTLLIQRFECDPIELCENSGFYEGNYRFPLIGWFGMVSYKRLAMKLETKEMIYNSFLKLPLSYYLVEVHLFVW